MGNTSGSNKPEGHSEKSNDKIGVLLVNLGTPDGTDYWSMRRYLREFLSDKRVIEWSRWFWYPILYGIVLNTRPGRVGKAYDTIWNKDLDESYLRTYTRNQSEKLGERLKGNNKIVVDWAMRYGQPNVSDKLDVLQEQGCKRVLVFPLYPQYSASTTATVNDVAFQALQKMRWQPALRTVAPYYDDPAYIEALANSITTTLSEIDFEPEVILASFHGIPQSYSKAGDPYQCHSKKTARLLREHLGYDENKLITTFQSRFGPEEWLQPYTDKTVESLAKNGIKNIAVINPGFVSDCLETLEEMDCEVREIFLENGGENFAHIPCLNDTPDGINVLEVAVQRELKGWV